MVNVDLLVQDFDDFAITEYLTNLHFRLIASDPSQDPVDQQETWNSLIKILKAGASTPGDKRIASKPDGSDDGHLGSLSLFKLLSRVLVVVAASQPHKVFDVANDLLGSVLLSDGDKLSHRALVSCVVLTDLFLSFPQQLGALVNFGISQLYKIVKVDPTVDCNVICLLNKLFALASKQDVDEKSQAKWSKIITKAISSSEIRTGSSIYADKLTNEMTLLLIKFYIQVLKNLVLLQISAHHAQLLAASASASLSAKANPEFVLSQRIQFQNSILQQYEELILQCFKSQISEVRVSMADFLVTLLHNFAQSPKFDPLEYLIGLYPLPLQNLWSDDLTTRLTVESEATLDGGVLETIDSIRLNENIACLQAGIAESFVMFVQLESLSQWGYFSSALPGIFDLILGKFGQMSSPSHIQNQQWISASNHWIKVLEFLLVEGGSTVHEIVSAYVVEKFAISGLEDHHKEQASSQGAKRQSIFGFKNMKKSSKGPKSASINPFTNPYQANFLLHIIKHLLPYGISFGGQTDSGDPEFLPENNLEEVELAEDEDRLTSKKGNYVAGLLLNLLANSNDYIRNYALVSLHHLAHINPSESNELILRIFQLVSNEFTHAKSSSNSAVREKNISLSSMTRLLSYSLALSSLIKIADSTTLQNSTIAKLLSFCTQRLKHSNNDLRDGACWVILASLVTFHDLSEFVKLNLSQLLVFWKNLLTSQFVGTSASSPGETSLKEITNNLKLRTLSLICLLNYIDSVHLTADLLKQLQFLLVKSHKFLLYMESNMEEVGLVTSFIPQRFNEVNFNPDWKSNLLFEDSSALLADNQLICLLLCNKKIVLQGFLKLSHALKSDVNSSLVVFLIRMFADPKLFSKNVQHDMTKEKAKTSKKKTRIGQVHENLNHTCLKWEAQHNFGLTGKFEAESAEFEQDVQLHIQPFPDLLWTNFFEKDLRCVAQRNINFDSAALLIGSPYTYSTNLITSLIDLSIEIFQRVFASLSYKIQFSLIDQLRSSLQTKNPDPLRGTAIRINIAVAILGLLTFVKENDLTLDENLVIGFMEVLELIEEPDEALLCIISKATGYASSMLSNVKVDEFTGKYIQQIVEDSSPFKRSKLILTLTQIHIHSNCASLDIYSVLFQLLSDPHPEISKFSIRSARDLLNGSTGNILLTDKAVLSVYSVVFDDRFGHNARTPELANMLVTYGSSIEISQLVRLAVTSLGPNWRTTDQTLKSKLKHLLVTLVMGIGIYDLKLLVAVLTNILGAFEELVIFDPDFVSGFSTYITDICIQIIKRNMKVGLGVLSLTSLGEEDLFPFTTSFPLYSKAFSCLLELTKIDLVILDKQLLSLVWTAMEIQPCEALTRMILLWIDLHSQIQWFSQMSSLFKVSVKKLTGSFLEINYRLKLLPLEQRLKKTSSYNAVDIKDEEVQNIVGGSQEEEDKNEPIAWHFKLFLYEMIVKYLEMAETLTALAESLKPRIQELTRMSYVGTTSSIGRIKLQGVKLLEVVLSLYGDVEDPLYPSVSILEQQQAQIISAIIPCFNSDSEPDVIVNAINVSSTFINLPRIKFYSKQRILQTLIFLLEEISSNKFLKFAFLESMAEHGKKAVQLSILNCWALLELSVASGKIDEPELEATLKKYSKLLRSLWILALKDLSTLKYGNPRASELNLYSRHWLNMVGVLSLDLERDPSLMAQFLGDEEDNFFFVLFCQCAEALTRNQDVIQVLLCVQRLVKNPKLAKMIMSPDIFEEVVDLLERLILVEDNIEVKCATIDTVGSLFAAFADVGANDDIKLEFLRVAMLPMFDVFPFLKPDADPEGEQYKHLLKRCHSAPNMIILKKLLEASAEMVPKIGALNVRACVLFILAKFFEFGDETFVSVIMPFVKTFINGANPELIALFANVVSTTYSGRGENFLILQTILATNTGFSISSDVAEETADVLLTVMADPKQASLAVQSIKLLMKSLQTRPSAAAISKVVVEKLFHDLLLPKPVYEERLLLEIIGLLLHYGELLSDDRAVSFFAIYIPVLLHQLRMLKVSPALIHEKVQRLLHLNANAFKIVVNERIDELQRSTIEELVRLNENTKVEEKYEEEIELKKFS